MRIVIALALPLLAAVPAAAQVTPAPQPGEELWDGVVAVVGDTVLLRSEVLLAVEQVRAAGDPVPEDPASFERFVQALIEERVDDLMLVVAARNAGVSVTDAEVQLAVEAREQLQAAGVPTRVVSMPSVEWFEEQDRGYRETVLPPSVKARVAVEAGIGLTWHRYVGEAGRIVSLEHFGASADYKRLYTEFGLTAEAVVDAARRSLAAAEGGARPGGNRSTSESGGTGDPQGH